MFHVRHGLHISAHFNAICHTKKTINSLKDCVILIIHPVSNFRCFVNFNLGHSGAKKTNYVIILQFEVIVK